MSDVHEVADTPVVPPNEPATPVEDRIADPVRESSDEKNVREMMRLGREKRELEGHDPWAEPDIARVHYGRHHGSKHLDEVTKDISDYHAEQDPRTQEAAAANRLSPQYLRELIKGERRPDGSTTPKGEEMAQAIDTMQRVRPHWSKDEAAHFVRTGQEPATKIGVARNDGAIQWPLADTKDGGGSVFKDLTANQVGTLNQITAASRNFREAAAAAELEALALQQQQQTPAVEQSQAPVEQQAPAPTPSQPQPTVEQQRIAALEAERAWVFATDAEREAKRQGVAGVQSWIAWQQKNFPELSQMANMPPGMREQAMRHLAATNPARLQQLGQAFMQLEKGIAANEQRYAEVAQQQAMIQQQRDAQEQQHIAAEYKRFSDYHDQVFAQHAPEMRNDKTARELRDAVKSSLKSLGFSDAELQEAWGGHSGLPLRDHRVQLALRKIALWDQAQARAKEVTKAPIPPVQRPGTARPRGSQEEADVRSLERALDNAKGDQAIRLAAKLTRARRAAGLM
jgi:hypothetical protein